MSTMHKRYTVILLAKQGEYTDGIYDDPVSLETAYFTDEEDAQRLVKDLNNQAKIHVFVVGFITFCS